MSKNHGLLRPSAASGTLVPVPVIGAKTTPVAAGQPLNKVTVDSLIKVLSVNPRETAMELAAAILKNVQLPRMFRTILDDASLSDAQKRQLIEGVLGGTCQYRLVSGYEVRDKKVTYIPDPKDASKRKKKTEVVSTFSETEDAAKCLVGRLGASATYFPEYRWEVTGAMSYERLLDVEDVAKINMLVG